MAIPIKEKHLIGVVYVFRGSVQYQNGETRCWRSSWVSYILACRQQEVLWDNRRGSSIYEHTVIHCLQQDHTYSYEATPPNGAIPFGGHLISNHNICLLTSSPRKWSRKEKKTKSQPFNHQQLAMALTCGHAAVWDWWVGVMARLNLSCPKVEATCYTWPLRAWTRPQWPETLTTCQQTKTW